MNDDLPFAVRAVFAQATTVVHWAVALVVAAAVLLRLWETWRGPLRQASKLPWLELGATFGVVLAAAMPLGSIAGLRRYAASRYFAIIAQTIHGESESLTRFAERTLGLVELWALMIAVGCGARLARAWPHATKWAVALCWGGGLACVGAVAMLKRALLRFASSELSDVGRVPERWLSNFDVARPLFARAIGWLAFAVVVCGLCFCWERTRRRPAEAEPSLWAVRLRVALLVLCLCACFWVWKRTRPFVYEAQNPLPVDHRFADASLSIWQPPLALGEGPDELAEGVVVRLHDGVATVDGTQVKGDDELFNLLKNKRELWMQLNAKAEEQAREHHPRVLLEASATERAFDVEAVLSAARAARIVDVRLMLTHRLELARPVFGTLVGFRGSAIRLELQESPLACEATRFVAVTANSSAPYSTLLGTLLEVRRRGQQVCKLVRSRTVHGEVATARARRVQIEKVEFDVLEVSNEPQSIEIRYLDHRGDKLNNLRALRREVESDGLELVMGMNAGMFTRARRPVGLLVVRGRELAPLDLGDDSGNFYLKPNGVFSVGRDGDLRIVPSERYRANDVWFATQSGPLLLWQDQEHPAVRPDSKSRHVRNAVCVSPAAAMFMISRTPVTFHELTLAFRELGCADGLYLDGTVSRMYAPLLGRFDDDGDFGPMLAIARMRP